MAPAASKITNIFSIEEVACLSLIAVLLMTARIRPTLKDLNRSTISLKEPNRSLLCTGLIEVFPWVDPSAVWCFVIPGVWIWRVERRSFVCQQLGGWR